VADYIKEIEQLEKEHRKMRNKMLKLKED